MRLSEFLNFVLSHGIEKKIEFIAVWLDGDFKFKCHLNDLFLQPYETFHDAFITCISYHCNHLHIEAE